MMFVPLFDRAAVSHRNAQARAKERLLDVVGGERISRKQHVDETVPDEMAHVVAAARMHDGGAGDHQYLSRAAAGGAHGGRHVPDGNSLGLFARHVAVHEAEGVVPRRVPLGRMHARAGASNDNHVAVPHVDHRHAFGPQLDRIDPHAAVHFLLLDADPISLEANLRVLIRRRIEAFGKSAVHIGGQQATVLLVERDGSVSADGGQQPLQVLGRTADHAQLGVARIVAPLADADLADLELSAQCHDLVEDLGQDQTVDDVPDNLHVFHERGLTGSHRRSFVRRGGR